MHFGNSEGMLGLKYRSRLWLGMDIFWNHTMLKLINCAKCLRHACLLTLNIVQGRGEKITLAAFSQKDAKCPEDFSLQC